MNPVLKLSHTVRFLNGSFKTYNNPIYSIFRDLVDIYPIHSSIYRNKFGFIFQRVRLTYPIVK